MVLVPEEFMEMLERKERQQTRPETKSLLRIDKKMENILQNPSDSADSQAQEYNQNLQRYLDVQQQRNQYIPTVKLHKEEASSSVKESSAPNARANAEESSAPSMPVGEILDSVPKNSQTLAKSMINRLKANPDKVTWNSTGEVLIDDQAIKGSNIIDLVNDQLRARKNFNPKGWQNFSDSLVEMNMPQYLMRNERRRNYVLQQHQKDAVVSPRKTPSYQPSPLAFPLPPTPPTTPRSTQKAVRSKRFKAKKLSDDWVHY